MEIMGSTIDDAVGEAFDKIAKALGLGYPGGPVIDRLAKEGDPDFLELPRGLSDKGQDRYNFSYSGLKTAVTFRLKKQGYTLPIPDARESRLAKDVCASFQRAAIDMLYRKAKNALEDSGLQRLSISGGVAANSYLRSKFSELESEGIRVAAAPIAYCGDNAAMIAGRAYHDFQSGKRGSLRSDAYSRIGAIKKGKRAVR